MDIQCSGQAQQMPTIARMPTASQGGYPMIGQRRQILHQQVTPQKSTNDQWLQVGNAMQAAVQGGYYVSNTNPQVQNQQINFEQYRQVQLMPFNLRAPIMSRNLPLQFWALQQALTQQLTQTNQMPMNLTVPTPDQVPILMNDARPQVSAQQDPQVQEQPSQNQRAEQESISNISQHQTEEFMEDRGIETQSTSKRLRIPVDKATVKKGDMPVKPINEADTDDLSDEQFADLFRLFGKLMDIAKRGKLELEKKKREEKSKILLTTVRSPFEYPCSPEIQEQPFDPKIYRSPSAFGLTKDEANEERMNMSTGSRLHFDFVD
ncbi:hypothetical protein ACOME3_008032 [Neoechinorhynchus agilis]